MILDHDGAVAPDDRAMRARHAGRGRSATPARVAARPTDQPITSGWSEMRQARPWNSRCVGRSGAGVASGSAVDFAARGARDRQVIDERERVRAGGSRLRTEARRAQRRRAAARWISQSRSVPKRSSSPGNAAMRGARRAARSACRRRARPAPGAAARHSAVRAAAISCARSISISSGRSPNCMPTTICLLLAQLAEPAPATDRPGAARCPRRAADRSASCG